MLFRIFTTVALLVVANTAAAPLVAVVFGVLALVVASTVAVDCLDIITATNRKTSR